MTGAKYRSEGDVMGDLFGKQGFMLLAGIVVGLAIGYTVGSNESTPQRAVKASPAGQDVSSSTASSPRPELQDPEREAEAQEAEPEAEAHEAEAEAEADTQEAEPVLASRGDQKACDKLVLASAREPNSPSWIDIVSEAGAVAKDYDLMDLIDKAYWSSNDGKAGARIEEGIAHCKELQAL